MSTCTDKNDVKLKRVMAERYDTRFAVRGCTVQRCFKFRMILSPSVFFENYIGKNEIKSTRDLILKINNLLTP